MNGLEKRERDMKTYYFLDGSVDWLKTAVRTVVIYKDGPVYVDSIAAKRTQNKYYARTMLRLGVMGWTDILCRDREAACSGGKEIRVPLNYGKSPMESLQTKIGAYCG